MEYPLNNKKTINGWAYYDWANSAFALIITVAIFPRHYIAVTDDEISLWGQSFSNSTLFAYTISLAYFVVVLILPFLSGLADYSGVRKKFMRFFTVLGSLACIALFFFQGMSQFFLGVLAYMLGIIGFEGARVFYNSYLPLISSKDNYDNVSAKGFSYGYVGSVLLLLVNLGMIMKPEIFGISSEDYAVRLSFIMVGLWWFGWAQIPFKRLPKDLDTKLTSKMVWKGLDELKMVFKKMRGERNVKRFLSSFFFYSAGVQSVLLMAATFAEKELSIGSVGLILLILILQVVAIGGAYLFAFLSKKYGNKISIALMLLIWIAICLTAYFVRSDSQFYYVAAAVGLVMGGIQSLSRSSYGKLIGHNEGDLNSYFSFYQVMEKLATVLGTFLFGYIEQLTGGIRNSILLVIVFFVIGILLLIRVRFTLPLNKAKLTS